MALHIISVNAGPRLLVTSFAQQNYFEGEFNRRQDGNYNGGFLQYFTHMKEAREKMEEQFLFTTK